MKSAVMAGLLATVLACAHPGPSYSQTATGPQPDCGLAAARASNLKDLPFLYDGGTQPAMFTVLAGDLQVNSDGSPRAYSLADPEGTNLALNDLPSGEVFVYDKQGLVVRLSRPDGESDEHRKARLDAIARYDAALKLLVTQTNDFGAGAPTYSAGGDKAYSYAGHYYEGLDEPNPPPPAPEARLKFPDISATKTNALPYDPKIPCSGLTRPPGDFVHFDCKENACTVCLLPDIIPYFKDKAGNPQLCIRKTGKYAGFLASSTSLDALAANRPDPDNTDGVKDIAACKFPIRTDAEKLAGFVLPKNAKAKGIMLVPMPAAGRSSDSTSGASTTLHPQLGDIVIGQNRRTGAWAYGVISDTGPANQFGEGSIAFARILRCGYTSTAARPALYNSKHPVAGNCPTDPSTSDVIHLSIQKHEATDPPNSPNSPISVLILPGTAQLLRAGPVASLLGNLDLSPENVTAKAFHAFLAWGNGGVAKPDGKWTDDDKKKAWDKFRACRAKLVEAASK